MDYSVRVKAEEGNKIRLDSDNLGKRMLPRIKDSLFKPKGVELKDFNPGIVCIRLRVFEDGRASLIKLRTINVGLGYSDEREDLGKGEEVELLKIAEEKGWEKWGELENSSTEYTKEGYRVLIQEVQPLGSYLKIEAESEEKLAEAIKWLGIDKSGLIEKNAAALLAEKMGLV